MLSSGIPILEAFSSIAEDTNDKKTRDLVNTVCEKINSGKSLSESLGEFSETFDDVFLNIIKSGEASGSLEKVLGNAADNLKNSIQTKNNIRSALLYPTIIISVLVLVAFFVFGYSLPQVAKVFFDLHLQLPNYSTTVLKLAVLFGKYKLFIACFMGVLLMTVYILLKLEKIRKFVFVLFSNLPFSSNLIHLLDLSRFTKTTGLLLNAGVPIINSLEISKNVVVSRKMHRDIESIRNDLTQGLNLEKSMKKYSKNFPSLLRRVVSVGEETGNLDKALIDISKFYDKKFTEIIKNLTVIIEPILIIFIAVLVALVLVSVILPIYQGVGRINRP